MSDSIPEHYLLWTFERFDELCKELRSLDNGIIEPLEMGEASHDSGPDFRGALIKVNEVVMRGDIEFHLRWKDWFYHGHHQDRRYEGVMLHVLWYPPHDLPESLNARFAHLIISKHLKNNMQEWMQKMLSLEIGFRQSQAVYGEVDVSLRELEELSWKRFSRKCNEIRSWLKNYPLEDSLIIALAQAMGFRKNSAPFTQLIKNLPPSQLHALVPPLQRAPLVFWIMLAWYGGLLDRPLRWHGESHFPDHLKLTAHIIRQFAEKYRPSGHILTNWDFSGSRPANNPYLRLAGLAQILFRYQAPGLFSQTLEVLMKRYPLPRLLRNLHHLLIIPLSSELRCFIKYIWRGKFFPKRTMGQQRCSLFILNLLIPFYYVWAQYTGNNGFALYLEDIYFSLPSADDNALLKKISVPIPVSRIKKAYVQQGILEYILQNSDGLG